MTSSIRSNAYRWLATVFAIALVLGLLVGSNQNTAQAIDPGETDIAYVADGYNFPDALMGATLAGLNTAPMLGVRGPTSGDVVPPETAAELDRLTNDKANKLDTIYVFGGSAAVSDKVVGELEVWANNVTRIAGANRFATMTEISEALPSKVKDSDLLDGMDSSDFLGATDKAADSELLDGIDSTGFVQSGDAVLTQVALPPGEAILDGDATLQDGFLAGINMPDGGTNPQLGWTIALPPNFPSDGTVTATIRYSSGAGGCTFDMSFNSDSAWGPDGTTRKDPATTAPGSIDGTGNTNTVGEFTVTIDGGSSTLEAGDLLWFGLYRNLAASDDTCTGSFTIYGGFLTFS